MPASPRIVFAYVADLAHLPEWCSLRLTHDPPLALRRGLQLGVQWERPLETTSTEHAASGALTVTEVDPPAQLGWTTEALEPAGRHHTWVHVEWEFSDGPPDTIARTTTEIPASAPIGLRRIEERSLQIEAGNQLQRVRAGTGVDG